MSLICFRVRLSVFGHIVFFFLLFSVFILKLIYDEGNVLRNLRLVALGIRIAKKMKIDVLNHRFLLTFHVTYFICLQGIKILFPFPFLFFFSNNILYTYFRFMFFFIFSQIYFLTLLFSLFFYFFSAIMSACNLLMQFS